MLNCLVAYWAAQTQHRPGLQSTSAERVTGKAQELGINEGEIYTKPVTCEYINTIKSTCYISLILLNILYPFDYIDIFN